VEGLDPTRAGDSLAACGVFGARGTAASADVGFDGPRANPEVEIINGKKPR
jgi:hypothetical protein